MKYFLIVNIALWVLSVYLCKTAEGDDFGRAELGLCIGAIALIGSFVYLVVALYLNRLL